MSISSFWGRGLWFWFFVSSVGDSDTPAVMLTLWLTVWSQVQPAALMCCLWLLPWLRQLRALFRVR